MEVMMIFTNRTSIFRYYRHELSWNPLIKPFNRIFIDSESEFWLVFDEIDRDDLIYEALQSVEPNVVYNLFHRKPELGLLKLLEEKLKKKSLSYFPKKSQHPDKETYGKVVEIDKNKEDKPKLKEIFNDLKKRLGIDEDLEIRLNFLHRLLVPSDIPVQAPDWLPENMRQNFENLSRLRNCDPLSEQYIRALRDLRNALLGDY